MDAATSMPLSVATAGSSSARKATASTSAIASASAATSSQIRDAVRSRELKAARAKADGESDVLESIAAMQDPDQVMAERVHAIVKQSAPDLAPRTWYGMPAYARDGKVVCFFQSAQKFKTRYATFGFSDKANLDDGAIWPFGFALKELTAKEEARIGALGKQAVG